MEVDVTILDNIVYVVTDETGRVTVNGENPSPGQAAITFEDEGVALGTRGTVTELDFVGSGVSAVRSANKVTVTVTAGGSGTPGGSNTQVQYNSSGAFAGASGLTTDGVDLTLGGQTASRIASTDANKKLVTLDTTTYPSLTELSYLKGVTSALQAQLNNKNPRASITLNAIPTANALTNQPNSEEYLSNNNARSVVKFDASVYTSVRLAFVVFVASASANTPRAYIKYKTAYSAGDAIGTFTTVGSGTGAEVISFASQGSFVTDWIAIPAGALADVWWACATNGGDGTADPATGVVEIQFK